jgi:hypothetical protein
LTLKLENYFPFTETRPPNDRIIDKIELFIEASLPVKNTFSSAQFLERICSEIL